MPITVSKSAAPDVFVDAAAVGRDAVVADFPAEVDVDTTLSTVAGKFGVVGEGRVFAGVVGEARRHPGRVAERVDVATATAVDDVVEGRVAADEVAPDSPSIESAPKPPESRSLPGPPCRSSSPIPP